jgi:predicted ATP-dependent serine protease
MLVTISSNTSRHWGLSIKTLHRTVKRGVSAGEPLPNPYPIFEQHKMSFRRGSISMIAGPPGSMKTVLTMNIVRKMGNSVPTLYHSSDSDDFTMASRSLAMLSGELTDETELWVMTQKQAAYEMLKEMDHVRWSFKSSPTLEHMWMEAEAFRELKGEYPHHTVIDIMMDIDYEGAGEQNYWALMAELKDMAREQETAITIVHHTSEGAKAGSPPPRSAIMGKANQLPTLILTLWGDAHAGTLDVATVKNRFGPQDAMGRKYFKMAAQPAICLIEEMEQPQEIPLLFQDGPWTDPEDKVEW